jgi:polyphosphate kinase
MKKSSQLNRQYLVKWQLSVMHLAQNKQTPLCERLRFIDIVQTNIDEFLEKYLFEVSNPTAKEIITNDLRTLYQTADAQCHHIIKAINDFYPTVKIITSVSTEELAPIFQTWIQQQTPLAESHDPLISKQPYFQHHNTTYKINSDFIIKEKDNIKCIYLIPLILNSHTDNFWFTLYRKRMHNFNNLTYYDIIKNLHTYAANECVVTCHLSKGGDIQFLKNDKFERPPSTFIHWPSIIEQLPNTEPLCYAPFKRFKLDTTAQRQHSEHNAIEDKLCFFPLHNYQGLFNILNSMIDNKPVKHCFFTVYRIIENGKMMQLFLSILQRKIPITIIFELKASYEEIKNIKMAAKLKNLGATIVITNTKIKFHAKIALIQYHDNAYKDSAFIGTGNWNEKHAETYTDLLLITQNKKTVNDIQNLISHLKNQNSDFTPKYLWITPINFKTKFISIIKQYTQSIRSGNDIKIIVKVNQITNKTIINALISAVKEGATLYIIARTCSFIYDKKGIITRQITGRFLEHFRVIAFYSNGIPSSVYIGSGDMKDRNIYLRYEVYTPIDDHKVISCIDKLLQPYITSTPRHNRYTSDGNLISKEGTDIHQWFIENIQSILY